MGVPGESSSGCDRWVIIVGSWVGVMMDERGDLDARSGAAADRDAGVAAGLRAFVLSDIRGYSSFAAVRGDEASAALTGRFIASALRVLGGSGGEHVGNRGDEVLFAFGSPRQAIRAAVAFERALLEATREDPSLPMPAGVGIDVGEAVRVPDGWRSNAINVAARLCSAAKAGEILATREVTHLAQAIDGVGYVERPAMRVKGIAAPVSAVRVVAEADDTVRGFAELGFTHAVAPPVHRRARRGRLSGLVAAAALFAVVAVGVLLAAGGSSPVRVPANSIAAVDPRTNSVVGHAPVGSRPGGITYGSGSLWVANLDDQTVSRIDPRSLQTVRVLPIGGPATGIAASDHAVWVVQSDPGASSVSVRRLDPEFDAVGRAVRIATVFPGDSGAVAAQGNNVWVAPASGLLTRLDPMTGRAVGHRIDPRAGPAAIALGVNALWVTDNGANNVTRIDPTGLQTSTPVGNLPTGIAVGAGGVWVANSLDDTVTRIDPHAAAAPYTIPVGSSPAGVAVGAGSVWVANSGDGTVTRIDPRTDKVQATITVGGSPQAIAAANGRVWVTVDGQTLAPIGGASSSATLRGVTPLDIDYMDPALAYIPQSWQLLYATCAKLLNYPDRAGPAGARLTPEVAQSLPVRSADGRTYTFTIRKGFRFSPPSNAPVTAQTFKYTIERTLNPKMHSPMAHYLADVIGAPAYIAGKAQHIAGAVAHGDTLTIHLLQPEPDFLSRIALPGFCAVPVDTPIDPKGVHVIPSAGPYYVAAYTPGQGIVLERNPNYRGSRPHQFAKIEIAVRIPILQAVANVKAGTADYASITSPSSATVGALASGLAKRYGPGSKAAANGVQQYFVSPEQEIDYLLLNTHRPLFSDVRLRQAVNYAIDRRTLAQLGFPFNPLPDRATDQYLPPGMPGYRDVHVYPVTPYLAKARALAHEHGRTAVLYTCNQSPCDQEAQIIKNNLAAIGLSVLVKAFPFQEVFKRVGTPGEPFDLATLAWIPDYPDPSALLNALLADSSHPPKPLRDPLYQRRLAEAEHLSGPRRYLAYGRLAIDLARNAAPLVVFGNENVNDFFSTRIGCQTYATYGLDFAALCLRPPRR